MKNRDFFEDYAKSFLKQNAVLNLISKNDEKLLFEKHIYDSMAIEKVFEKYPVKENFRLLDIGTGGGFPSVIIALLYPEIEVFALDSIKKKVNAIENIKSDLDIKNLHTICDRAENINDKFDIITSRAVAPMKVILGYAMPLLKKNGIFVAYKSLKVKEELYEAKQVLKKFNCEIKDIIEYNLPTEESHTRNLVVCQLLAQDKLL